MHWYLRRTGELYSVLVQFNATMHDKPAADSPGTVSPIGNSRIHESCGQYRRCRWYSVQKDAMLTTDDPLVVDAMHMRVYSCPTVPTSTYN